MIGTGLGWQFFPTKAGDLGRELRVERLTGVFGERMGERDGMSRGGKCVRIDFVFSGGFSRKEG